MSNGIPLDKAELLGTLLEGILYGFSLLMFGGTIWQLLFRRSTHRVNRMMLSIACLLLVSSTVHLIINIIRIIYALIRYRDAYLNGPTVFLADVSQWTFVSNNYIYTIQTLLGDLVILYRCYMVWQSKYIMIVPIVLWCAAGVTGFGAAVVASRSSIFGEALTRWITAFYAMSLSSNISANLLLTWRIWYTNRKAAKLCTRQESPLRPLLHIIIDAGLVYSLTLFVGWICFLNQSYAQFVVQDVMVPIVSITFYTVIICVGFVYRADKPADPRLPLRHTATPSGK